MTQPFTVQVPALRRAIDIAATVIQRRNAIPVLSGLKATANGAFVLEGTDLDNHARVQLADDAYAASPKHEESAFVLMGPREVRAALGYGAADVEIGRAEDAFRVELKSGDLALRTPMLPACDFPTYNTVHFREGRATLGAEAIAQIARVTAAISSEETRYYLNGVVVHKIGDWLYRFAATDGHRLMAVDVPLPDMDGAIPDGTIIPKAWLYLALRHFRRAKTGCTLTYGKTLVRNETEGAELPIEKPGGPRIAIEGEVGGARLTLTGKLIDGTFPDYSRVIPTGYFTVARIDRAELVKAVRAVSGIATKKTRAVKLTFQPGAIHLSLNSPEMGESSYRIAAEHNVETLATIGMNGRYLLDHCTAFTGGEIEMHFAAGSGMQNAPVLFRDPADTAFLAVLMPMRV
jgi:DNA polymerase-3 subunit beta